jgi:feruloyl esterase
LRIISITSGPTAATGFSTYWVFGNDFDLMPFDFDHHIDTLDDEMATKLKRNTADLEGVKLHDGKSPILTHGFADPVVPTLNTVAYYERLIASQIRNGRHDEGERKEGLRRTQEFAQLLLLPGAGAAMRASGRSLPKGDLFLVG